MEFLFLGGALRAVFFGVFFPNIFSGSGQKYVMCILKTSALDPPLKKNSLGQRQNILQQMKFEDIEK